MASETPVLFGETSFVTPPYASIDIGASRLVWADGGNPVVVDQASAAILGCFGDPLTPDQLADDMVVALGMERGDARRAAARTTYQFRLAGLVVSTDQTPREPWRYHYPPAAST